MQRRKLHFLPLWESRDRDGWDEPIRSQRSWPARAVGKIVLGVIAIAGSAMVVAPGVPESPTELPPVVANSNHIQPVLVGAFSPDGTTFATCGLDKSVRLWDASRPNDPEASPPSILADDTVKYAVAFSRDGSLLGAVGPTSLTIWSARSGRYVMSLRKPIDSSSSLAFSPDGRTLAIGSDFGDVSLHDVEKANEGPVLRAHTNAVRSLSFSPNGRYLVSAGQDSLIMLWDAIQGVSVRTLVEAASNPNHVTAFSPDGGSVAVGEIGGRPTEVLVVDVGTGRVRTRLAGHAQGICALAFSPDGRTLATAGADHTVKLWNVVDGTERSTLFNDIGRVNSLSFSRDGTWLAYAGDGLAIKVWDSVRPRSPRLGFVRLPNTQGTEVTIDGAYGAPSRAGVSVTPMRLLRRPMTSTL